MSSSRHEPRSASRLRGLAQWSCAVAAGVLVGAFAGCSTADCKSMKGSGSAFGDLICGGQGTDAPEPDAPAPNACSDIRLVMPGFFKLLEDPSKPLDGLRQAVASIGAPQCQDARRIACTPDTDCPVGDCGADNLCPCQHFTSPLADLLVILFKGLNGIAADVAEPGAPQGSRCVSIAQAATLPASQINRMCELRRTLDVLLQQNGGQALLDDPNVNRVIVSLLQYIEGKKDGTPHYDLFTTLGRMAQNPGICSPTDAYDAIDKLLQFYAPPSTRAASDIGAIQTLLADPITQNFLKSLSDPNGGSASGRASFITIAKALLTSLAGASSGADALSSVHTLLNQLVYNSSNFPQSFKSEVQAFENAANALLSPQAGIFPLLQKLLACLNNPIIDNNGELAGALYDLVSLQSTNGNGIDLATLIGALKTLVTLDQTGQVPRSLRLIIEGARNDDTATEAVRSLLAQVLTAEIGKELLPPLDTLVENKVLGEVVTLLDDLLYSCTPPKTAN